MGESRLVKGLAFRPDQIDPIFHGPGGSKFGAFNCLGGRYGHMYDVITVRKARSGLMRGFLT